MKLLNKSSNRRFGRWSLRCFWRSLGFVVHRNGASYWDTWAVKRRGILVGWVLGVGRKQTSLSERKDSQTQRWYFFWAIQEDGNMPWIGVAFCAPYIRWLARFCLSTGMMDPTFIEDTVLLDGGYIDILHLENNGWYLIFGNIGP